MKIVGTVKEIGLEDVIIEIVTVYGFNRLHLPVSTNKLYDLELNQEIELDIKL